MKSMPTAQRKLLFLAGSSWMETSSPLPTVTSYPSSILLRFVAEYGNGACFYFVLTPVMAGQRDNLNTYGQQPSLFLFEAAKPQVSDMRMFSGVLQIVSGRVWDLAAVPPCSLLLFSSLARHNLRKSYRKAT